MKSPYTVRIFVADGEPDGIRVIDKMNWTGKCIVFPREKWSTVKQQQLIDAPGVYVLVGYSADDEELPILYIGEGDGIQSRVDSHHTNKDFWTWGIAFISANNTLNKAHVQWLEYALVAQAKKAGRCQLENSVSPTEPVLTPSDRADIHFFLNEALQILPLVGLHAFQIPKAIVASPAPPPDKTEPKAESAIDTVVVPAMKDGFVKVFLGESRWRAIRISGGKLEQIRWIAAYQTAPVSAITHIAKVSRIEPYGENGKYQLIFAEPAQEITPIPFADAPMGSTQGIRYTTLAKLKAAKKIGDLFPWG